MRWIATPPVILDFDNSVLTLSADEIRLGLSQKQEALRYGCSWPTFKRLEQDLSLLPTNMGCLFLGSGDYHHLSLIPLKRLADIKAPLEVVVCDNHPDNMRYFFGVHCGSWVRWAAVLPGISHVHVLGITSPDITWPHALENHWQPLLFDRLTYWCIGQRATWLNLLGGSKSYRSFNSADELLDCFCEKASRLHRVYLSIDKDVFNPQTVKTNWDQGTWEKRHLETLIAMLAGRLAGADVTGEVSGYTYKSWFKRLLTKLDKLEKPDPFQIKLWQSEQQKFNLELLSMLQKSGH